MLMWRCAPLPAELALSFGTKLAVRLCLAATERMASLVYSSASVACTALALGLRSSWNLCQYLNDSVCLAAMLFVAPFSRTWHLHFE